MKLKSSLDQARPSESVFRRVSRKLVLSTAALASVCFAASTSLRAQVTGRVFAPYIDMSLSNNNLSSISQASGIKYFTLAFIISNGSCSTQWGGLGSVSSDSTIKPLIDGLRSRGGDVIISFGGAAGSEPAVTCTSVSSLQAAYQAIINKYGVKALDFDVEGSELSNTSANDRRNAALAALQAANPGLYVSYTLPVETSGLLSESISLLNNAKSHGVKVGVVNIMTMDFGSGSPSTMGQNSIDAANSTISQLNSIGLTSTTLGITVLIGTNDQKPQIFTISDAHKVEAYAEGNSRVTRMAFWEVSRDKSCANNAQLWDDDNCSGITQSPWDFSHIFEPFGGTVTPPPVADPTFSPGAGTYTSAQSVTISTTTSGASIRYTVDGSTPSSTAGTLYSGPINVSSSETVKAIAFTSSGNSNVTSATYTINTGGGGGTTSWEAESLTRTTSGATATTDTDSAASGGARVTLASTGVGQYVEFTLPNVPAGTYSVQLAYKTNANRGILNLKIDGSQVGGTLDQYASAASYPTQTFGTVTFASTGDHALRLTVTGKNSASSSYTLSADKIILTSTSTPPPTLSAEAESLSRTASGATATTDTDSAASGGARVTLNSTGTGQYVEFTFPNVPAGTYSIQMAYKTNANRGILAFSVDGTPLGAALDQYASAATYPTVNFGTFTFASAGSHTFRLTVTGKNSASSSYTLSADKFTLVGQ